LLTKGNLFSSTVPHCVRITERIYMSDTHSDICREGIVKGYADGRVRVLITVQSACASCHAKGACTSLDMSEKVIDARADGPFEIGEKVKVAVAGRYGWTAVLYAFVLPMVILFTLFFTCLSTGSGETQAALSGLAGIAIYFLLIRIFRDRLFGRMEFHVERITNCQ